MRRLAALVLWLALAGAAAAIEPSEVLEDPGLQARAMALYDQLRCVKCQSETIASSNADWARDARALVRERLVAGDSDAQVLDFFVNGRRGAAGIEFAGYGDFVLMRPRLTQWNLILWLAGPVLLLAGAAVAAAYLRRRTPAAMAVAPPLSEAEKARLRSLTGEG
jgi:cytochrome c-type biogenesis protein CcmH